MQEVVCSFAASLIGTIILFLIIKGKIKMGGPVTVYPLLMFLPLILPFVFVILVFLIILFPLWILAVEVLIFNVFIFIKINVFPSSQLEKNDNKDKKIIMIAQGRRLLHYAIYSSLIYLVPISAIIINFIIINHGIINSLIKNPGIILGILIRILGGAILGIVFPPAALPLVIIVAVITTISILIFVVIIMSINGTIRIVYGAGQMRKRIVLYIIAMLFPVVNIVCMLYLCRSAKYHIETKGIIN